MADEKAIRRLLVATDGSAHAERAVAVGGELARAEGAQVILVHVQPSPAGVADAEELREYQALADMEGVEMGDVFDGIGKEIIERAEAALRALGVEDIEPVMPSGNPAEAILDHAAAEDVDLIVMGTRGLGKLKSLLLGSVSKKVSKAAPCECRLVN